MALGLTIMSLRRLLNVSKQRLNAGSKRWKETKDLNDRPRKGRSRVTIVAGDQLIVNLVQQDVNERITSQQIQQELQREGVHVIVRTVGNHLVEAGFKYSRPLSKPLLSEQHQHCRLNWAQLMKNYDWNKIILNDETTIRLNVVREYFWQRRGERTVKYPLKINVWDCLSVVRLGRIVCFQHNLNSSFLCREIYKYTLLPTSRFHFGRRRDWVLVEGNDPKHRSNSSQEWKKNHHITTPPWPSQSPNANPIENVWSLLKIIVATRKPKTIREFKKAIYKE